MRIKINLLPLAQNILSVQCKAVNEQKWNKKYTMWNKYGGEINHI